MNLMQNNKTNGKPLEKSLGVITDFHTGKPLVIKMQEKLLHSVETLVSCQFCINRKDKKICF
jgi:hypothetical protein